MAMLNTLPNEILSLVTNHLDHPRDVLHLSLASHHFAEFVRLDGWKAFLKGRFKLSGLDSDARNTVHGLTTLYRNWHRKGFIAKYLEPSAMTMSMNTWQPKVWRGSRGQTMGYRPSIDSFEGMFGSWNERREVLAWSAGTQIVMRIKETGKGARQVWEEDLEGGGTHSSASFDAFRHCNEWYSYKVPDSLEGRDDVTSLKLLRPNQVTDLDEMVFGTASGRLSLLSWDTREQETREKQYDTYGQYVGSISVSPSRIPLLAATLGDTTLNLYPIRHDNSSQDATEPISQVSPAPSGGGPGRIWSCNFLSHDKVALGMGPSSEPIHVYEIRPDGFLSQPLRAFDLDSMIGTESRTGYSMSHSTSIYPILPVPSTAQGGSSAGNVFLSGGYDGIVRLHDIRSPRGFETIFWDPTNDSSVYSLAAQGLERVVAGVSMHSMLKVFDLRLSGSHTYHTANLPPKPKVKPKNQDYAHNAMVTASSDNAQIISGGWNLYLNSRIPPKRGAYREDYWRGGQDSPVYSLSIPSPTSLNVYAGLEGTIQSLTFHSIADRHPDPHLSQSIVRFPDSGTVDVKSSYDPQGQALNLGMYEQGNEDGLGMELLVQDGVNTGVLKNKQRKEFTRSNGLDERWKDLRHESERWARVTPRDAGRGRGRGRGHGRGGRGRGRGGARGG